MMSEVNAGVEVGFVRWPAWRRWFGDRSERAAARFLRQRGYRILAANVQLQVSELDLLAIHNDIIVVVEVRSSQTQSLSDIASTVNLPKQQRLTKAALKLLQRRRLLGATLRFDVLAIRYPFRGEPEFLHLPDAFQATERFQIWG
ncbi:MAG: YraN family protein [Gemmataceae bacterium]